MPMKNLSASIHRHGAPGTWVLVALLVATFLVAWSSPGILTALAFIPAEVAKSPWTTLTYPVHNPGDGGNFLWYVVLWWWLWSMGGDVEGIAWSPARGLHRSENLSLTYLVAAVHSSPRT